jgi:SNF2 family DNA or RNA helicase
MRTEVSQEFYAAQDLDWFNNELKEIIGEGLGSCKLKIKPFYHQYQDLLFALDLKHNSKTGLYSGEGIGKSLSMLLVALAYISWGNRVVLYTLTPLFQQMKSEVDTFFIDFPCEAVIQPKYPTKDKQGLRLVHESPKLLLMSYSTLIIPRYWARVKRDYDFIICDEASEIKNGLGRRFERLSTLMSYNKGILLATATPFHISYADCFAYIKLTYGVYKDFHAYKRKHGVLDHFGGVKSWSGTANIRRNLFTHGLRRTKEKLLDLPPTLVSYRTLSLTESQNEVYSRFHDYEFFESLQGNIFDASYSPTLKHQRMIQAVSNPELFEQGTESSVMTDLSILMKSLAAQGEKMLVFFIYADTAKKYYDDLSFNFNISRIYDDENESQAFLNDPSINFCFASYKKGSKGFSFGQVKYLYLVEIDPSAGTISQALNRISRANSLTSSTAYIPNITSTVYDKSLVKLKDRTRDMGNLMDIEGSFISKL